ncbi:MAG: nucleotidyl transferase AbiEii/AbiGii toxin family protein [Saccharofermentanales bacterium]|jgi:predicted nucleotidyltransferase component of viral defense system
MNKNKLNSLVRKISKDTGIVYNSILAYYFMEDVLSRISKSDYRNNFIFKGGFLLSNIVGISTRATVDIDFILKNKKLSEENIEKILIEILRKSEDSISYKIDSIKSVKERDFYGGFRVILLASFENIRQYVPLDIATGDIITPYPINYDYVSIFDQEIIPIKAYPIETIVAEKMETIYSRGFLNSRSKDYFDLYLFCKLKKEEINTDILKEAIENTFFHRKTEYDINKFKELINQLNKNQIFTQRWNNYRNKNNFVGNLELKEVIAAILELLRLLELLE